MNGSISTRSREADEILLLNFRDFDSEIFETARELKHMDIYKYFDCQSVFFFIFETMPASGDLLRSRRFSTLIDTDTVNHTILIT